MPIHITLESDVSGRPTKNYLVVSANQKPLGRLVFSPENLNPESPGEDWYFVHSFDETLSSVKMLGTKEELKAAIEAKLGEVIVEC